MIPDNVLSTEALPSAFLSPRDAIVNDLEDYDNGPIAISDSSQGLMARKWKGRYADGNVIYSAPGVADQIVYSAPKITELSITFDQSGHPCFAFVNDDGPQMYWYDTLIADYAVYDLPPASVTPKVALDDKRSFNVSASDILLSYIKNGNLYFRMQRDRFGVEYLLKAGAGPSLKRVGMNTAFRFQWEIGF